VSRNSILRFDPATAGSSLTATREWNLTADLPAVGANLGMEATTWIPDSFLTSNFFFDDTKNHTYVPSEYADHGTGLFFVGLETTPTIYVYALDHVTGGFSRVTTITNPQSGVMDLEFDSDLGVLWSVCDDGCLGRSAIFHLNPVTGKFVSSGIFDRPGGMANLNNEGFAIASATECVNNRKPAFWADDSETAGHALGGGNVSCLSSIGPSPVVPEFPTVVMPALLASAIIAGWFFLRRRQLAA